MHYQTTQCMQMFSCRERPYDHLLKCSYKTITVYITIKFVEEKTSFSSYILSTPSTRRYLFENELLESINEQADVNEILASRKYSPQHTPRVHFIIL